MLITNFIGSSTLFSAEMSIDFNNKNLSANIRNINLPVNLLLLELKSGLPNYVNLIVIVGNERESIYQYSLSLIVTYDLWDEHYMVNRFDPTGHKKVNIKGDQELLVYLANHQLRNFVDLSKITNTKVLTLSYRILFNPVKAERIKKIKNWIRTSNGFDELDEEDNDSGELNSSVLASRRSTNTNSNRPPITDANGNRLDFSGGTPSVSSGPRFQKLFDKILEQNMSGDSVAADWKSEVVSKTFSLTELINEKP